MTNRDAVAVIRGFQLRLEWEGANKESREALACAIAALCPVWYPMSRTPEPVADRAFDGWLYWVQLKPHPEDPQKRSRYDIWYWMGDSWERALSDNSMLEEGDLSEAVSYAPVIAPEV